MILWPAIDIYQGQCVRLKTGDYTQKTVYSNDPLSMAQSFYDQGAEALHIVDLSRAKNQDCSQIEVIGKIAETVPLKLEVGGGIRSTEDCQQLRDVGVERIIIGSLAVKDRDTTETILEKFDQAVLAVDVRFKDRDYYVAYNAWRDTSLITVEQFLQQYPQAKSILCTDIGRDGLMGGPNTQLYQKLKKDHLQLEILASGGVNSLEDLKNLKSIGCDGAIVGKAIYENNFSVKEAMACLRNG